MFRQVFLAILLGFLGVLIQGAVLRTLWPELMVPNFLLVLVVFLSFYQPTPLGLFQSFFLGLTLDMASGLMLGPWAGSFVVVFAVFSSLSQRIFVESPMAALVTVFLSSLLSNLVFFGMASQVQHSPLGISWSILVEALLTAVVSVPLFPFFCRLLAVTDGSMSKRVGAHA